MAQPDADIAWQLLVTAVISSGFIVVMIESFREWLFKRRQEFVEQSKQKIEIISKGAPYYNQLATNSWNFGWNIIEAPERDYERLIYYICNMLYLRHNVFRELGDLQFDNLDAERIINDLWNQIISLIERQFGYLNISKLRCLVENDIPYHKFHESLSVGENKELYEKFVDWITKKVCIQNSQDLDIIERCMWYAQLIQLELNHIYKSWYGQEPPLILRPALRIYLQEKEKKYYDRIKSFHLKTNISSKHSR